MNFEVSSAAYHAHARLETLIVTLELPPGSMTTEAALNTRLGLGRTPVREALLRLSFEGLVEIRPRSGLAITAMDASSWPRLIDTMAPLEMDMVRRAALMHAGLYAADMRAAALSLQKAMITGSVMAFLDAGKAADVAIARASENHFAARALAALQIHARRYWFRYQNDVGIADAAMGRLRLLSAILQGDAAGATDEAQVASEVIRGYARKLLP